MTAILFTSLCGSILILTYIFFKRRYSPSISHLPGMKPQIFFGNLFNSGLLTGKKTFLEVLIDYQRLYGDKFQFWFGSQRCLIFCRTEHIQAIFTDRHTFEQSPVFASNFYLLCPRSVFLLTGDTWRRHVRVMRSMFKRVHANNHCETIIRCIDRFIERNLQSEQIHRNLIAGCQSLQIDFIGFMAFDYDLENHTNSFIKMALQDLISHVTFLMISPRIPRWLGKIYLKYNWKLQHAYRLIHELTDKLIDQELKQKNETEYQQSKTLVALLTSSLNERADDEEVASGLTRTEIFDELVLSLVTSYETVSTAIAWFIFFASKYPHVQKRIKSELREHNLMMTDNLKDPPPLTNENVTSLIYCECVTKEVLRLAPIAGLTTRVAIRDTVLDDVKINCGQTIFIPLYNVNTDARNWHHADSQQFAPERFLDVDKNHHPLAMIPFGGGHRACIGRELAMLELKLAIIRLMQRGITFEDTSENTGGYVERITYSPKNLVVRVHFD